MYQLKQNFHTCTWTFYTERLNHACCCFLTYFCLKENFKSDERNLCNRLLSHSTDFFWYIISYFDNAINFNSFFFSDSPRALMLLGSRKRQFQRNNDDIFSHVNYFIISFLVINVIHNFRYVKRYRNYH